MKKTIVITGGSRGIGYAIMECYAKHGYDIAFCSQNLDSVKNAHTKLSYQFPDTKVLARSCNMSDKQEVLEFGQQVLDFFENKVDVLVNNAGQYVPGVISEDNFDDRLEELMKTNLYSAYWLGKVLIPKMKSRKSGHIFNMSSIAGIQAYPNGGSYAITKYALTGYNDTLREELTKEGIKVTGIFPGATLTDSWAGSDFPPERFIQPNDIAELIYTTSQLSIGAVVEKLIIRPQLGDI